MKFTGCKLRCVGERTGNQTLLQQSIARGARGVEVITPFPKRRYTLAPLIDQGADALACADIPGMEDVKLTEIQLQFRGPLNDRQTYRSKDFFASLAGRNRAFPNYGELVSASFAVKFEKADRPRTVKIRTPNIANFDRKEDSHLIETWLRKRGFVIEQETDEEHEHTATAHHAIEAAMA